MANLIGGASIFVQLEAKLRKNIPREQELQDYECFLDSGEP